MQYLLWCTVSAAACCWPKALFHKVLDAVDTAAHVFYKHFLKKMITRYDVFLQLDGELRAKHEHTVRTWLNNITENPLHSYAHDADVLHNVCDNVIRICITLAPKSSWHSMKLCGQAHLTHRCTTLIQVGIKENTLAYIKGGSFRGFFSPHQFLLTV